MRLIALVIAGAMTAFVAPIAAQQTAAQVDSAALLAKIQADKRQLVGKSMNLTPEEAARFWPLYDKFQRELDSVNRRQNRAVLDYVAADGKLTEANADRLARELLDADVDEAKLHQRHYAELKKKVSAVKAARYIQIENKMQAVQRFETAKVMPLAE